MENKLKGHLLNRLKHPEAHTRPVQIIHHYFPKTAAEANAYLDRAVELGMGGFCVNMDDEGGYLKEASGCWEALGSFIDGAFQRGLCIWIYDEKAYPSGAAHDLVLKELPDARIKGLVCRVMESEGGIGQWDCGRIRYGAAYPVEGERLLKSRGVPLTEEQGTVRWKLPPGKWRILVFEARPIRYLTENKVPYVDLLREDVTDAFLAVTHDRYRRHLGEERIRKITAFFTDEPGLAVHGCSSYFDERDAVCAWTEEMDSLLPGFAAHYVDLFYDTDGDFAASRRKWWKTVQVLFSRNYFGRIAGWCQTWGTAMTGHLYGEETLSMQIGLNGDLFGLMEYMQMPGVDRLYCVNPRDVTAEKTASSAAHLYGRTAVMSENSFHLEYNWWKTPEEATTENRLNSAYYQAQLGVTHAASYFAYPDENRVDYETKAARAGLFTSYGTHQTDVLVLIPMTAAYERFAVPNHKYWNVGPCTVAPHQGRSIQMLEEAYGRVLEHLEDSHFDFDLINEEGLCACPVSQGKLSTGYEEFSNLVIFDSGTWEKDIQRAIRAFLRSGGRVTVVNTDLPTAFAASLRTEFPENVTFTDADEIARSIAASPVLSLSGSCDGVRVKKTVSAGAELYFIHNRQDTERAVTVSMRGKCTVCSMDMEVTEVDSDGEFDLTIPPKDGVMLMRWTEEEPIPPMEVEEEFRILQLTDPQITDLTQSRNPVRREQLKNAFFRDGIYDNGVRTYDSIRRLVKECDPHLIVITGDLIYGETDDRGALWLEFTDFMDSLETPWTFVWGNHDNESARGVSWQIERLSRCRNVIFRQGNLPGNSNFAIPLQKNGRDFAVLIFMDTNGCHVIGDSWAPEEGRDEHSVDEGLLISQDCLTDEQCRWYGERMAACECPSYVFLHIPPHEVDGFIHSHTQNGAPFSLEGEGEMGEIREIGGSHRVLNPSFWETAKKSRCQGIFFGHEHKNSGSFLHDGIRLTYGLKTGSHVSHLPHMLGGTLTVLRENGFTVEHLYDYAPGN